MIFRIEQQKTFISNVFTAIKIQVTLLFRYYKFISSFETNKTISTNFISVSNLIFKTFNVGKRKD